MKNVKRILPVILCMVLIMGGVFIFDRNSISKKSLKTTDSSSVSVVSGADGKSGSADGDTDNGKTDIEDSSDKNISNGTSDSASDESKDTSNGSDGNADDSVNNGNGGNASDNAGGNGNSDSATSSSDSKGTGNGKPATNGGDSASGNTNSNSSTGGNSTKPNNSTADKNNSMSSGDNSISDSKGDKPADMDSKSFVITVYKKSAPETCKNFDKLVKEGFYNGLRFYRVIENFLAETGDPNCDGTGGSKDKIKGEFMSNGVDNRLSHTRGMVSMNRSPSDPNSANSRFFICYNDNCSFMDGNYAVFGKVTEGMRVVDDFTSIESVTGPDGTKSLPATPITIKTAEYVGDDKNGNAQYRFYVAY